MTTSTFSVAEILTVMHGRMLCDIGGVYRLCNHLVGESLMTHQLPRASRESEASLRAQFPDLAAVDVNAPIIESQEDFDKWLSSLDIGSHRDVTPLPPEQHTSIDPIAELRMMRPDAEILAVEAPE